jgi:hypothetical protein
MKKLLIILFLFSNTVQAQTNYNTDTTYNPKTVYNKEIKITNSLVLNNANIFLIYWR